MPFFYLTPILPHAWPSEPGDTEAAICTCLLSHHPQWPGRKQGQPVRGRLQGSQWEQTKQIQEDPISGQMSGPLEHPTTRSSSVCTASRLLPGEKAPPDSPG